MAPEYAEEGIFSIKSDVFSFGVLVLEIVSGEKNRGFVHKEHSHNLLGHVSFVSIKLLVFMCSYAQAMFGKLVDKLAIG